MIRTCQAHNKVYSTVYWILLLFRSSELSQRFQEVLYYCIFWIICLVIYCCPFCYVQMSLIRRDQGEQVSSPFYENFILIHINLGKLILLTCINLEGICSCSSPLETLKIDSYFHGSMCCSDCSYPYFTLGLKCIGILGINLQMSYHPGYPSKLFDFMTEWNCSKLVPDLTLPLPIFEFPGLL